MADNVSAPHTQTGQATILPPGTPVILRSETTVPTPTPVSPTSFEFWTPILAFAVLISTVLMLIHNSMSKKVKDAADSHKPLHDQIGKDIHRLANDITSDRARIHQLENFRQTDVERIVSLETNMRNIEKGQERIEHQLDAMKQDAEKGRAEIIQSLRELRDVKPRA